MTLQYEEPAPEVLQGVADIKHTVEAVKVLVGKLMHDDKRSPKYEATFSDEIENLNNCALEVGFSGILKLKTEKIEKIDSQTQKKK